MADFCGFRALRFDPAVAGDAAGLISPPYDVVFGDEAAALYARSPFNISRVDFGERRAGDTDADNSYTRARADISAWRAKGVLVEDETARMYVYDQEFTLQGEQRRRRAIFGRLRLEEWEKGIVLPHEYTGAEAKTDRLNLLRATRVHLSPIMALYAGTGAGARPVLSDGDLGETVFDAVLEGERHRLRPLSGAAAARVTSFLAARRLYIADGHHRYETALTYRNEIREPAPHWSGDEPENFLLAALIGIGDPNLVVLPTHRLISAERAGDLTGRLQAHFEVEDFGDAGDRTALGRLEPALAVAGESGTAFGAIGLDPGRLHLLRARDPAAIDALLPQEHAPAWRRLDVNVLEQVAYRDIGFTPGADTVSFSEDAAEAMRAVVSGEWTLAFLLNATPVSQVVACSDAGERMPRKSTYFYPKLATGVVMYPLD